MKTKICIVFNHLQIQDGVCRSAIAIANHLSQNSNFEITLVPIYKFEKDAAKCVSSNVKITNGFGFYFKGFSKVVDYIPGKILYKFLINDRYDINIAFQYGHSIKIIASGANKFHTSIGWMHCYDEGLTQRNFYLQMDQLICVSKCNAHRLKLELDGQVPVEYCYNPINDVLIRQHSSDNIQVNRSNILQFVSVGRMSEEKGYARLLNCVAKLKELGYIFNLWLIGDGCLLQELKQQVVDNNLTDYVCFLGKLNNPHAYTSKADLFICSSFIEGYSTACTEAIMLGIPVLTTNVSGGKEIIEEAECGLLTEISDDSLFDGLKYVLDTPEIINEWKDILVNTKNKFSYGARVNRLIEILEKYN